MALRLLLTGCSGYIGSNLTRILPSDFYEIVPIGRETGYDLSTPGWTKQIPVGSADIVLHLAQSRHYRQFPKAANDIFSVNVASTMELLEWSREHGVSRFILASSGNVYGPYFEPVDECSLCKPDAFYGASKLASELLLQQYRSYFETLALRMFGVYGPNQKGMLIPTMMERVSDRQTIFLNQNHGIFLSPLYIDDCTTLIKRCLDWRGPFESSILNLAGKEVISLGDIVRNLGTLMGIQPVTEVRSEPPQWFCARSLYPMAHLENEVPIQVGLEATVRAFISELSSTSHQ